MRSISNFIFLCLAISTSLFAESGLDRLLEGNKRYVNDALEHPNRTSDRREALSSKQEPFAIVVSCSDSRVAPTIVFDQGIGDIFVVRVAGNVIGPLGLDSIEFATLYLHSSTILVLGHENCGAVNAVIKGTTKDIESIARLIEPAVKKERKRDPSNLLESSVKANARNMKKYLEGRPVIKKLIASKKLDIYAGYYNLRTGAVEILKD